MSLLSDILFASDGSKMSKRKQNYPEPRLIVDKYGADACRFVILA